MRWRMLIVFTCSESHLGGALPVVFAYARDCKNMTKINPISIPSSLVVTTDAFPLGHGEI